MNVPPQSSIVAVLNSVFPLKSSIVPPKNMDVRPPSSIVAVQSLIAADEKLQQFLNWVHQKSRSVEISYKPAAVRAFYFSLDRTRALDRARDPELKRKLQEVRDQVRATSWDNRANFKQWWQNNSQAWTEQLRAIVIEHRNIGHDWQFSNEQKQLLKQYYDANKLLVDCLNSNCYVSRNVRQDIEDTLLLPMSEIEAKKQDNAKH